MKNLPFPILCSAHNSAEHGLVNWSYDTVPRKEFKFSMVIPGAFTLFKSNPIPPSLTMPIVDCAYFKDPNGKMEVIVQSTFMQHEVSMQHLLQRYAELGGETIIHERIADGDPDKCDMLLSRTFKDGQTWITRRTGYKVYCNDCAGVIVMNAAVNLDYYTAYAELLFCITDSLKPIEKPEYVLAERLRLFSKRYPGDFATYIPESWQELHHHNNNMKKFNAVFTKRIGDKVSGILNISTLSVEEAYDLQSVLNIFHGGYIQQGMQTQSIPLVKTTEFSCFPSAMKGEMEFAASATNPNLKNLLTFYIAEHKGAWFYLEMFGPARKTDFDPWAVNQRALYLAVHHFQVA